MKIDFKYKNYKSKEIGELLEIEAKVEELYAKTEKEVLARISEKDLTINQIWKLLQDLQRIESQVLSLTVIKKCDNDFDQTVSAIRKLIRDTSFANETDLKLIKQKIQEEDKLRIN